MSSVGRAVVGAVALAGVLSAGCGSAAQTGAREVALHGPVGRAQQVRYLDPAGWSVSYPGSFHRQSLPHFSEFTVASFPVRRPRAAHGPYAPLLLPLDPGRHFPSSGVALTLEREGGGGPPPDIAVADSRFPIRLDAFVVRGLPASWESFRLPLPRLEGVEVDGTDYIAEAWIGKTSTRGLRQELGRIVSSLAFPRLQPGTVVGERFAVLRPASGYPVGTATRVEVPQRGCGGIKIVCTPSGGRESLYLVHAPGRPGVPDSAPCRPPGVCVPAGAFYTVGEQAWCPLRFDSSDDQFYCPGTGRRWDRVGRPIRAKHSLNLGFAKIGWDGHVVTTIAGEYLAPPPRAGLIRLAWPNWRQGG